MTECDKSADTGLYTVKQEDDIWAIFCDLNVENIYQQLRIKFSSKIVDVTQLKIIVS